MTRITPWPDFTDETESHKTGRAFLDEIRKAEGPPPHDEPPHTRRTWPGVIACMALGLALVALPFLIVWGT